MDVSDPKRTLLVELCAGAAVVAKKRANLHREDIRLLGYGWFRVGFTFTPAEIRALVIDRDVPPDAPLWVRVAGTSFSLRASKPVSSPAEFLAADPGPAAAPEAPAAGPDPSGDARPDVSAPAVVRDLPAALQAMAARAADLLRLPLTPSSERVAGYIENLSWEQEGLVWIFGWMRGHLPLHAPVVVADGAKYPSALVVATYEREDLPKNAFGIVGLLKTNWRPNHRGGTPLLFLGDAAEACLPLVERPKLLTAAECAGCVEAVKPRLGGPFVKPLLRMFGAVSNWAPDSARVSGAEVKACADKILVLPGFGCLVEGWALSPFHAVERFMLRVGESVLMSDPRSISRKPRLDLLSAAPDAHRMAEAGGFVAAFLGQVDGRASGEIVLKVVCEGGLSTNHPVDADAVRVLGGSASFDDILRPFPAVRAEPFFPDLARCVSEGTRRLVSTPVGFEVRPAEDVLAVAVPDDGSDMALLFSELALAAQRRGRFPPVVALARAGQHRSAALSLFDDLRRNAAAASSLFFVPDPAYAVHALDEALGQVGATRFAFVGSGVFPTDAGWDALLDRLEEQDEELVFLPVESLADGSVPADSAQRAECFAWHRRGLAAWLARTPVFLSGSSRRVLTLPAGAHPASPGVVAKRGRRAPPSVLATWVNEHLFEACAEATDA